MEDKGDVELSKRSRLTVQLRGEKMILRKGLQDESRRTPWGRWWSARLGFPVCDVRPAGIDGSAGAWPAHSNLHAHYQPSLWLWFLLFIFFLNLFCCHLSFSTLKVRATPLIVAKYNSAPCDTSWFSDSPGDSSHPLFTRVLVQYRISSSPTNVVSNMRG